MAIDESRVIPTPPNIIRSLLTGFDTITNHISLVLFPVFLDLFLWFGPHLNLRNLIETMFNRMANMPEMISPDSADLVAMNKELWSTLAEKLNLLALLRTYPVGIPSLMVSILPTQSPQGLAWSWQIPSIALVFICSFTFTVGGLLLGTFYFDAVAQATLNESINWRQSIKHYLWMVLQVFLLSLFWFGIFLALSIPVSCLISVLSINGMTGGKLGLLIAGGVIVWLIFPLLLSSHGIFVFQKRMWVSIRDSVRLTRFTFPTTVLLFLAILLISEGLNVLWRIPGDTSWLLLVGVAGHGFISTGLLAATFIYYRDASIWLDKMLQQIKFSSII